MKRLASPGLPALTGQLFRPPRPDRDVGARDVRSRRPAARERRRADRRRLQLHERAVFPREACLRARVCAAAGSTVGDLGRRRASSSRRAPASARRRTPVTLARVYAPLRVSTWQPTIRGIGGRSSAAPARSPPTSARSATSCCSAASLRRSTWTSCRGSSATRLLFPADFVGRGDMSRGGLLLRCVTAGEELHYVPVAGAIRHGQRPPKLAPLPRAR